ncbi:MAG: ABC transporter ATP-binding protein [Rhodobacteraceae bacterium]|nr:ABC transporter ATP-binding protein [Paracoccaceae bacterium]
MTLPDTLNRPELAKDAAAPARMELRGIAKGYGEPWERTEVLDRLDFDIEPGKLTVLVGPSGCGKSTIVNLVAGYDRPDTGKVMIDGRPVRGPAHERMVVFQESALIPWQTTYENIVFGPRLRGDLSGVRLRLAAEQLIDRVGLADFRDKYPAQLSGGMQRRAELARALINNPRVMILDEPFRGLDAMSRQLMHAAFLGLFEAEKRTGLFVTSELDEAILLGDRLIVLSNQPARVRAVIDVSLPRPRSTAMLDSAEAYEIKRAAMELLHEEALRSFVGGSQASDLLLAHTRRR